MKLLNIVLLLLVNLSSAQSISSDWTPIHSDEESVIYLNSSKILGYGNEISAWAIENLEEISYLENGEKISRIKTHYLFDKMKKRFVEIGIIYYDNKGQIVNRSSKSNMQGTSAAFMAPIKSDAKVEIIYREVISFIITGNVKSIDETSDNNTVAAVDDKIKMEIPSEHRNKAERNNEVEQSSPDNANGSQNVVPNETATNIGAAAVTTVVIASENSDDVVDLSKEEWNDIPKIDEKLEIEQKPTLAKVESSSEIKTKNIDESINIQVSAENHYNSKREKALKNSIFTDGSFYCFQVSSWKTESYAKRELNKLLSEGYNAFIVSIKPAHKNSIWHRVRVGYFNSLQETKRVQRLVGKR